MPKSGFKWTVVFTVVVLAIVVAGGLFYFGKIKPMISAGKQEGQFLTQETRRPIENFQFETKTGLQRLGDYKGKVVLVDVWASWCAPCLEGIPKLVSMANKYQTEPFQILALSVDEKGWLDLTPFLQKHPEINYPIAVPYPAPGFHLDTVFDLNPLGNVAALPTVFVIDRQGRLAAKFVGAGRYQEIDAFVAKLLTEETAS